MNRLQGKIVGITGGGAGFGRAMALAFAREGAAAVAICDLNMEDAAATGLTEIVPVIASGMDIPGTVLEKTTDEFRALWEKADLVIAKGQGNYETLNDAPKDICILLRIKCAVVAEHLHKPVGSITLAC